MFCPLFAERCSFKYGSICGRLAGRVTLHLFCAVIKPKRWLGTPHSVVYLPPVQVWLIGFIHILYRILDHWAITLTTLFYYRFPYAAHSEIQQACECLL